MRRRITWKSRMEKYHSLKFIDTSREQNICVRGQKMLINFLFYFSSSQPFRYNNQYVFILKYIMSTLLHIYFTNIVVLLMLYFYIFITNLNRFFYYSILLIFQLLIIQNSIIYQIPYVSHVDLLYILFIYYFINFIVF